jgi:uncharacterized protein (TIGR03437 family)
VVTLYGFGADFTGLPDQNGVAAPEGSEIPTATTPEVFIFGQPAQVTYSGLAPGFVNTWQLNFIVPNLSFISGQVPVNAVIQGVESNVVSIWVAE